MLKRQEILEQTKSTVFSLIKNFKISENLHSLKAADTTRELIVLLDSQLRGAISDAELKTRNRLVEEVSS